MLQSEWSRTARMAHICDACPAKDGACMLTGAYNNTSEHNLIVMLESPDFSGRGTGTVVRTEIRNILNIAIDRVKMLVGDVNLQYSTMYACASQDYSRLQPPVRVLRACAPYMQGKLREAAQHARVRKGGKKAPNVILALGPGCAQALQLDGSKFTEQRGRAHTVNIHGETYIVVPTVSTRALFANPNTLDILVTDLRLVVECLYNGYDGGSTLADLTADYVVPRDIQDVTELADTVCAYVGEGGKGPDRWAISLDTETTGVLVHDPDFRALMLCVGWDAGKAGTIVLDHKDTQYDPVEAKKQANRITSCPKPKIMHNAKFDANVLVRTGMSLSNLYWDTILGHHWINEGVSGYYGLKVLTLDYAPAYAGYEDELARTLVGAVNAQNYVCYDGLASVLTRHPEAGERLLAARVSVNGEPEVGLLDLEREYCDLTLQVSAKKSYSKEQLAVTRARRSEIRKYITSIYKRAKIPTPAAATVSTPPDFNPDGGNYELIPLNILSRYGGVDADITRRIAKLQIERVGKYQGEKVLAAYKSVMKNQYIPGTHTLARMQRRGTRLDYDLLHKYREEITAVRDTMEHRLRGILCDGEVNLNSGAQLGAVIQKRFNLPDRLIEHNEDGSVKVDAGFRLKLKKENEYELSELAYCLSVYGQACKALGNYLTGLERSASLDGRVHTSFNLNGTSTGRLSSSDPNLQNVPMVLCAAKLVMKVDGVDVVMESLPGWKIKSLFIPDDVEYLLANVLDMTVLPDDEMVFFNLDIASAEVRVLCAFLPDGDPLRVAVENGLNVPSFMTAKIFGLDYDYVERVKDNDYDVAFKRTACKRVLYGLLYGQGTAGSVEQIYGFVSEDPVERQTQFDFAKSIQKMLFDMSPGTEAYIRNTHLEVGAHSQVWSLFGRARRFPMIRVDNSQRARAERQAVNFKIQTAASDLLLSQMCELDAEFRKIGGELLLTVHDSIVGQVPKRVIGQLTEFFDYWIVERIKQRFPWLPVPYQYEISVGPDYGAQVPLDMALNPDTATDAKYVRTLVRMGLKEAS